MSIGNRQLARILEIHVEVQLARSKAKFLGLVGQCQCPAEIKGAIKHPFTLPQYDSSTPEQALVIEKFVVGKMSSSFYPRTLGKACVFWLYR